MRTHRVYTPQALEPGCRVRLEGRQAHYLGRVLRLAVGQVVVLFNGDGCDYASELLRAAREELEFEVTARLPALAESPLRIAVVQAVSRGERMDQTLQKCTELGAAAFQPVWSDRVEVRLKGEKLARRLEHWRGVVTAACEQSGRARVPEVFTAKALADWAREPGEAVRLVLAPRAGFSLASLAPASEIELAVGPEGGFSESELKRLEQHGVRPVALGPRVLRTETAAPAAIAALQTLFGDFR